MRNTKVIDPSLNKKIVENEIKIHDLFNTDLNKSKSRRIIPKNNGGMKIDRNIRHKKNMSQDEIYKNTYNNNEVNIFKSTIDSTPYTKTIQVEGDEDSMAFINKMEKRIRLKSNTNKKEQEKNNKIFYNTFNNVYQKLQNKKSKKVYNKGQVNNIVDRLYNNDYKHKKQPQRDNDQEKENSAIDYSIKTGTMATPVKKQNENNANVDEMIERFEEDIKKRNEKIEEIKKNEKAKYTYKPKLKKNKKYEPESKDNFLERQKKYEEKIKLKEQRYKEELKKREQEKINKNNYLLKKKKNENNEREETNINKKESVDIDKTIKNLYEWDNQRKKKIEKKQKEILNKKAFKEWLKKKERESKQKKYEERKQKEKEELKRKRDYLKKRVKSFTIGPYTDAAALKEVQNYLVENNLNKEEDEYIQDISEYESRQ
jgi:hypothetical protein